ncbi:EamA family transporter [Pseudorhodobacter sp.]|uniref:EamA family transporter n=1 Tax=Pseudorhodobacter sp. TaxID=1934400 RepID=UPI002AFEE784|nr:EamA family transporter [Pseudorhodobacter sp.]
MQMTWLFWALASAGFAAITAILAKLGVADVPADSATLVRTVVILVLVALIAVLGREGFSPGKIPARSYVFLILSGLATGASWLCYFRALQLGDAAKVAPIDKLSVVLVAVFAAVFLGEHLSLPNWMGVGLIALGAGLLAWRG